MTNGGPEGFRPQTPGEFPSSEEARRRQELQDQQFGVRIETEGEEQIRRIKEAGRDRLLPVVERAFAYREGLFFHPSAYQLLDRPDVALHLETRFTSAEGSTERGYSPYVDTAIKNRIAREIDLIFDKAEKNDREPTEEEKDEINRLMSIENAREARTQIDIAFIQRMKACQQGEKAAGLLDGGVTPDKGHWQAILSDDFGEKVDRVLRRIVAAGFDTEDRVTKDGVVIPGLRTIRQNASQELRARLINRQEQDRREGKEGMTDKQIEEKVKQLAADMEHVPGVEDTVYANGFQDTETFRKWLSHLLKAADGRIDVVWTAWRLALLWEFPAQVGEKKIVNPRDGKFEYKIADPPIGNDLFTWTMHLETKRKIEWGWNANDQRDRLSKYLTHTGYPLSLGRIAREGKKQICESFLHQSRVFYPSGSKDRISLWRLWWEKGMQVGGHFGKDTNILPWAATELQPRGLDTDELPPGSFGFWLLTRARAHKVVEDIRSTPSLRDISDPTFFSSRLRNWEKVIGELDDRPTPEENPRTWWVAGILLFGHRGLKTKDIPLFKEGKVRPELRYTAYYPEEQWGVEGLGRGEKRKISVYEILNNAIKCGFLREKDANWIIKELALPAVAGGTVVGNLEK